MKRLTKATTKKINTQICNTAPGLFNDEYWMGQKKVTEALDKICQKLGLDWNITKSQYFNDGGLVPVRKVWHFKVSNETHSAIGVIIAAGAGSVEDPLSKYDIVAYI